MSDFISLKCPSCGQMLSIPDDAGISDIVSTVYTCGACGVKSILKRDTNKSWLEAYAACPICNRNDRATKLSALAKAVNKPQIDLRYPMEPRKSEFVPKEFPAGYFDSEKFSVVPKKLDNSSFRALFLVGIFLFVLSAVFALISPHDVIFLYCFYGVEIGVLLLPPLYYGVYKKMSNAALAKADKVKRQSLHAQEMEERRVFDQAETERKKAFEQTEAERRKTFEKTEAERVRVEIARWKNAVARWEQSYYCERDDIVFIPGANDYDSSENLQQFLYRTR